MSKLNIRKTISAMTAHHRDPQVIKLRALRKRAQLLSEAVEDISDAQASLTSTNMSIEDMANFMKSMDDL
jgi:hypothetical protein